MAYESLARIPVGTAVFEEVAFRGVLPGLIARTTTEPAAVGLSSLLFGLWHVLHIPVFMLMVVTVIVHIFVVHWY